MYPKFWQRHEGLLVTITIFTLLFLVFGGVIGAVAFTKNFARYQRLEDERNMIQVNEIQIQQTEQLVKVAKQKAEIKVEEAEGIAEAQRIINDTLTPQYLQHEAIQAQETQSNKIIYVPSGNQGIPLVQTVNP